MNLIEERIIMAENIHELKETQKNHPIMKRHTFTIVIFIFI